MKNKTILMPAEDFEKFVLKPLEEVLKELTADIVVDGGPERIHHIAEAYGRLYGIRDKKIEEEKRNKYGNHIPL